MAKDQKHYTSEFKQQIVDLYNAGGTSYPQLEREYGINRSTLSSWAKPLSPIKVFREKRDDVGVMTYPLEYMSPKLPGFGDIDWGNMY